MSDSGLIGSSEKFRDVLEKVNMVASAGCTVLIQGETGTGKEVIAQTIHKASPRRNNRFVALNCAAIPATLLESELFGHERGAFTGPPRRPLGAFRQPTGGLCFWTKSVIFPSNSSQSSSALCRKKRSSDWEAVAPFR